MPRVTHLDGEQSVSVFERESSTLGDGGMTEPILMGPEESFLYDGVGRVNVSLVSGLSYDLDTKRDYVGRRASPYPKLASGFCRRFPGL